MFKARIYTFLLCGSAIVLSGCSEKPVEKVQGLLADGEPQEAVQWLDEKLSEAPQDQLYNALAAEAALNLCLKTNCFDSNPALLQKVSAHLQFVPGPVTTEDGVTIDVYNNILNQAKQLTRTPNHPAELIALVKALPDDKSKVRFHSMMLDIAIDHLMAMEIPAANSLLMTLLAEGGQEEFMTQYIGFLTGLINNDEKALRVRLPAMRAKVGTASNMPPQAYMALPYALYIYENALNPASGTSNFIADFQTRVDGTGVAVFKSEQAKQYMGRALKAMANDEDFLNDALPSYLAPENTPVAVEGDKQTADDGTPTPEVQEQVLADPKAALKLQLKQLSLAINPQQPDAWQEFLNNTSTFASNAGDTSELFENLDPKTIPASIVQEYNTRLFALAEDAIRENRNALPFLTKIAIRGSEEVSNRVNSLTRQALDKAVKNKQYEYIVGYAAFRPDLAKPRKQEIVTSVIQSIENRWENNDFDRISDLADFLINDMEIDFNLDSLLLQSFDEFVSNSGLIKELSTESPDMLLQPQPDVAFDLGPKFDFLRDYFSDQPEIVDTQLKNVIVSAQGKYGTATAMYRLFEEFDEKKFPREERKQYLVNTIKSALMRDDSLDSGEMAEIGFKIHRTHPEVPLLFVIGETLNRVKNLEEARQIWANVEPEFKQALRSVKPQFTTLMFAIDAFENGERRKAAELFVLLQDAYYLNQAKPYIQLYRQMLEEAKGTYLADEQSDNMNVILATIEPQTSVDLNFESKPIPTSAVANTSDSPLELVDLLGVRLTLINAVGSVRIADPEKLTENSGNTYRASFKVFMDPDRESVEIKEENKAAVDLPKSFERIFGDVRAINLFEPGTAEIMAGDQGETYTMERITPATNAFIFPDGKYGIVEQLSVEDTNTSHVLPVGTIIDIKTDEMGGFRPLVGGERAKPVYPVYGTVIHPTSPEPRSLTGRYNSGTHTVDFNYKYPYGKNGATLEASIRCHILANYVVCAGHNTHWSRSSYSHIVEGRGVAGNQLRLIVPNPGNAVSTEKPAEAAEDASPTQPAAEPEENEPTEEATNDDMGTLEELEGVEEDEPTEQAPAPSGPAPEEREQQMPAAERPTSSL